MIVRSTRKTDFYKRLDSYKAVSVAEGLQRESEENQLEAWQYLIDHGICWGLQGWFGRTANNLIDQGLCSPKGKEKND